MESKEKRVCRPDCPSDGPQDGVMLKTDCIRTDFIENPGEGEAVFQQREKGEASITASAELGVFSIRDRVSGIMLTVSFGDAMAVMADAVKAAKEVGSWQMKTSENADSVENVSDS